MIFKDKTKCRNNKIKEFNCGKIFYLNSKNFISNYLKLNRKVSYPLIVNIVSNNNNQMLSFSESEVESIVAETLSELK